MLTLFWTTWLFIKLGVAVPNTINTHEFHPSVRPGSKFKIPSQYFVVTSLAFLNFCQLLYFYMLLCLHSIIHCKFYTLTNQLLLLWHKYLESLGKNNVFTHVFFCSMSWRTNTNHRTTIQKKQQIM